MPSPIGHFLGGIAAGRLVAGQSLNPQGQDSRRLWRSRDLLLFGALGTLADIDFLVGAHSTYTHSVGAALLAGVLVAAALRRVQLWPVLALAAAYGSHILLDWLGDDTTPPIGILALWPFTADFHQSDLHWFMAISRRYRLAHFWSHNLAAVAWEIALLAPLVALVLWWGRART